MKVKSLLLAAAAFVALGASAQSISLPNIEVTEENVGQVIELPLTLTQPEGANFTNLQFHVVFPEGVRPAKDAYDTYGFAGDDIPLAGRPAAPVVVFSDNFKEESNWPEYDVFGLNSNKIQVDANPCHIYTMNVMCTEDAKDDGQFKFYLKATQYDDSTYELGSSAAGDTPGSVVYTELYTPEGGVVTNTLGSAVSDVNVTKAVASVKYYNAAGMASDTAFDGINIVVTKYVDGSQSTAKIVK